MSRLTEIGQDLNSSWRAMQAEWENVREEWRDDIGAHFEREWWNELEAEIPQLLNALADFDEVFDSAARQLDET
ncbi:MAG TPA: hypothetical protein VF604_04040 [Pyrinomonadaceae bacterium]|jgi:hypothetical protein